MSDLNHLERMLNEAVEYLSALRGNSPKQDHPDAENQVRIAQVRLDEFVEKNKPEPEPVVETPKKVEPVKSGK